MTHELLMEKINSLPPEKISEVVDFVEFLAQRQEAEQNGEDVADVRRRQANADPSQRRTLDDLRRANGRSETVRPQRTFAERARSFREWAAKHGDLPTLPEEAFGRSSFYGERG